MKFFRRYNKLILLLVFPAICLLFYNNNANWHQHQLDNGGIASHAHPFSKQTESPTPFQKHNHSESEYFILDKIIQFFLFLVVVFYVLNTILPLKRTFDILLILKIPCQKHWFIINDRAPPLNLISS